MIRHGKPGAPALRRAAIVCGSLAALWLATGCGGRSDPTPDAAWPTGALLSGDRDAIARSLRELAQLDPAPLARVAEDWLAALPDCDEIEGRAADLAGLPHALRCAEPQGALSGLHTYRRDTGGGARWALALPIGDGPRVLVRSRVAPGRTDLEVRWPHTATAPRLASLGPGDEAAGPPRLARADRVLHAHVRSDALDLASLAPVGSQADELFRLRNALLSAAVLDGRWEVAIYPPLPGEPVPRVAVALGVRAPAAARAAAERFLEDVEAHWPVHRVPARFHAREGACLPQLRLLPGLAPCLVADERALVLGWNAASLSHALGGDRGDARVADAGRVEVDFARLHEADRSLAALHGGTGSGAPSRWPWRRLVARGTRDGDAVDWRVQLETDAPDGAGGDS